LLAGFFSRGGTVSRGCRESNWREDVLAPFGNLGANFGKWGKGVTPSQLHLRQKSALFAAEKYYTPEEFG
jgi:hypothetical protein